jgi:hypothetical protein
MHRWVVLLSLVGLSVYGQAPSKVIAVDVNGAVYTGGADSASLTRSSGTGESWRTQLGSAGTDQVLALTLSTQGHVWAGGLRGTGGFVAELDSDGAIISQSRFPTAVRALTVDFNGSVYLARDGFIEKLGADGKPAYSLAVRAPVTSLATDPDGALYATLGTSIDKINSQGTEWLWSVDLGPSSPAAILVNADGSVYVTGTTRSLDFPTVAAVQPRLNGPSDAFVARIKPDGSGFEWSTYLGGCGFDAGTALAFDPEGNLWVAGYTTSSDFPGSSASPERWHGAEDGFVARLDSRGGVLESRYFGTPGDDRIQSLAVNGEGHVHVAGWNDEGARRSFTAKAGLMIQPRAICDPLLVTSLSDSVRNPVCGTLRFAVANAPAGATIIFARNGTITLDTSAILDPPANTFVHNNHIKISRDLTIKGPGAAQLTIDGANNTRIFFIQSGSVAINGLTLAHGLAKGGDANTGGAAAGMGGAIFQNDGSLSLSGVIVANNKAIGGKQGVAGGSGGAGFGGDAPINDSGASGGDLGGFGGITSDLRSARDGGDGAGGSGGNPAIGGGGGTGGTPQDGSGGFGGGGGKVGLGGFGGGGFPGGFGASGGSGAGFGGAIFVRTGVLTITDTAFVGNAAIGGDDPRALSQGKGGGLFLFRGASAAATRVTFSNNSAQEAGIDSKTPYGSGTDLNQCPGQDNSDVCGVLTGTFTNPQVVSSLGDTGPGTLRAIFDSKPVHPVVTFTATGVIHLQSRLLIDQDTVIQGPGAAKLTIDGGGVTRLLFVSGGNVSISAVTLANGVGQGGDSGDGGGAAGMGGAVFQNGGSLTLSGVVFSGNRAVGGTLRADSSPIHTGGGFGGAGSVTFGGSGGDLGGTGGGSAIGVIGGNGGDGAGGGSGGSRGGDGGFGGGGGAHTLSGISGPGGNGGFGGGGGGGASSPDGSVGARGGFGGGQGRNGGGGAGFGGAIFVRTGVLTMIDTSFKANVTTPGGSGLSLGEGKGGAVFILQGAIATATRVQFSGSIAADAGVDSITGYDGTVSGPKQCPGLDNVDICGILLGAFTLSPTVQATNLNDAGAGSLRNTLAGAPPGAVVTLALSGTLPLRSRILISRNITIQGPGADKLTIDGGGVTRLFFIQSGTVSMSGLTLANGLGKGGNAFGGGAGAGMGGAIFQNNGALTLTGGTLTGNKALGGSQIGSRPLGGAGFSDAPFNDNGAEGGDLGGVGGVVDPSLKGGNGGDGAGGGAGLQQPGNGGFAGGGGGLGIGSGSGIGGTGGSGGFGGGGGFGFTAGKGGFAGGSGAGGGAGLGGAVFTRRGSLTLTNVTFSANTAEGGSGGNKGSNGQGKGGALFVLAGATATATGTNFSKSAASDAGVDSQSAYDSSGAKRCPGLDIADLCGTLTGSFTRSAGPTLQVSNVNDSGTGSLRDTVTTAPAGTTILLTGLSGKITLLSRILINKDLTLQGPGAAQLTLDGGGKTRLFFIQSGTVAISGLTLANGLGKGGNASGGGAGAGMGGAIFQNGGALTLSGVTLSGNKALGGTETPGNALGGGGFSIDAPLNNRGADGGDLGGAGGIVNANGNGGSGGDGAGGAAGFNQPGNGGFAGGGGGFGGSGGRGGFGGGGGFGGADIGGGPGGFGGGGNGAGGGAGFGGAIFTRAGTLTLLNVAFNNNSAVGSAGSFGGTNGQGKGGALFVLQGATASATNVVFASNVAAQAGVNSATGYDGTASGAKVCAGQDTVNVCGVLPVNLLVTGALLRDASGNLQVTVTVANAGGTAAEDVMLTNVAVNVTGGSGLPLALGTIKASESSTVTVHLPGPAGVAGTAGLLNVGGKYSGGSFNGGSFNYASRVMLP